MPMLPAPRRHPTERPPHTLGGRPAENLEPPRPTLPTDVSQPKEVKGRRLLVPPSCTLRGEAPKLHEPSLRLVQPQPKLPQSPPSSLREPCRVVLMLKGTHHVVR